MQYFLIIASAFFASLVSFYSGFGLGTILMPIIAIFFPLPIAIGITAIVHLVHNLVKATLLWRAVDWAIVIRFGTAAWTAAIFGALLLKQLSKINPIYEYNLFFLHAQFSILHFLIGILLILIATLELFPSKTFGVKNLFLGGAISGFFGGLSGNQGAFRSIFLINKKLDKKVFIATNAIIAAVVDVVRLIVYLFSFKYLLIAIDSSLLGAAITGALLGIGLAITFLPKIKIIHIKRLIVILLYGLGILLAAGII